MDRKSLRLQQLDETFGPLRAYFPQPPRDGWIKAIRTALGVTTRQMAKRLRLVQSSYVGAEASEAKGTITLAQLRRLADALECDFVYAVVPRRPLSQMVEERATRLARERISRVAHSMALEDQGVPSKTTEAQVDEFKRALRAGPWSRLWE